MAALGISATVNTASVSSEFKASLSQFGDGVMQTAGAALSAKASSVASSVCGARFTPMACGEVIGGELRSGSSSSDGLVGTDLVLIITLSCLAGSVCE